MREQVSTVPVGGERVGNGPVPSQPGQHRTSARSLVTCRLIASSPVSGVPHAGFPKVPCRWTGLLLGLAVLAGVEGTVRGEDWPQFRGMNASGVSGSPARLPVEFSFEHKMRWQASLGDGVSCPIVSRGRVFATGMADELRKLGNIDGARTLLDEVLAQAEGERAADTQARAQRMRDELG